MGKTELVDKMAEAAGITKAAAGKALDSLTQSIIEAANTGEKVSLVGFGTFSVAQRKARKGRNPRTGEEINVPAKKMLKFKASSALKIK